MIHWLHWWHRWQALAVAPVGFADAGLTKTIQELEVAKKAGLFTWRTIVLEGCTCGARRATELDGKWTLEQLKGAK